jgi:hypothetical protein
MEIMEFDRNALLVEAYQRVVRKSEIKCTLEQGGVIKAEVEGCLSDALRCVEALCQPSGAILKVTAEAADSGVLLARQTLIHSGRMRRQLEKGAQAYLYLFTCGYDSQEALQWLDKDYSIHHFQNMIGRELLYAIGRDLHRQACACKPDHRMVRYAAKMQNRYAMEIDEDAVPLSTLQSTSQNRSLTPDYWDAGKMRSLLGLFGDSALGVSSTDAGCFSPLYAILGVMMAIPHSNNPINTAA